MYKTQYHIVWIPKYRRKVLVRGVAQYLEKVMDTYLADRYPDVVIKERKIQLDHIHILAEIPPKYAVSKIIGDIKSNTARKMRKKFDFLKKGSEMWAVGYFVSTVGLNEKVISAYIRYQEKQDKGRAQLALG